MWTIFAVCLLLIVSITTAENCNRKDVCRCETADGTVLDISKIGKIIRDNNPKGAIDIPDAFYPSTTYSFNPCIPFSDGGACGNVLACQHHQFGDFDIGSQKSGSPSFEYDPTSGTGLQISYVAGLIGNLRHSVVTCLCDLSVTGEPKFVSNGEIISSQEYDFTLTHECCCPNACGKAPPGPSGGGSGLSLGSVLLLLLFCSLIAYFVFGAVFLKYRRGAAGVRERYRADLIPNASFWTEAPGLVKDGAMFLVSKCFKRGNYESMA